MGALEEGSLLRAEVERLLQLGCFNRALRAEEDQRWVCGDHGARV